LRRLNHHHMVKIVVIFLNQGRISIVIAQAADTDLKRYLEQAGMLLARSEYDILMRPMRTWPTCLVQGIDYCHEYTTVVQVNKIPYDYFIDNGEAFTWLAFLILDPNLGRALRLVNL